MAQSSSTKISSTKISNQLKVWWFPLLVAAVIILGTLFVLIPQTEHIASSWKELAAVKKSLTLLQTKADQVNQLLEPEIDRWDKSVGMALPNHKPYYETFALLQMLASETGVLIGDFALSPGSLASGSAQAKPVNAGGYVSLDTDVTVTGTTDQVIAFVDELQQSLPLLTVKSITISGDTDKADQRRATIAVTIHYMPSKNGSLNIEAPLPQMTAKETGLIEDLTAYKQPVDQTASVSAVTDLSRSDLFSVGN